MGALYNKMARDLKLKNLAERTQEHYLGCCEGFVRYHRKSPAQLGESAIREYLGHLHEKGAGPETLKMNVAALKFLYGETLGRPKVVERLPWPRVPQKKPDILSGTEVQKLLGAVRSPVSAMVAATAYGAGLRISEACRLRVEDIDSKRCVIHVRLGKGGKDRYVMLSALLLELLRAYWRRVRPPAGWLFPGGKKGAPISQSTVNKALKVAKQSMKLKKRVSAHVLRHSFATHLLEMGHDIRFIQVVLGHASIRTTARYAQVSAKHLASAKGPMDLMGTKEAAALG